MAINIYNIRKWYKMLTGTSVLHVDQGVGKSFSANEIKGYYNDLTGKVKMEPELVDGLELPLTVQPHGKTIVFPVAVFQYGLGCYDLYLQEGDKRYLKLFLHYAAWTLEQQDSSGRWANFAHCYPENPFGAMAQGEAASLLIRAYKESGEQRYLDAARKAIDYMLIPLEKGGTTRYDGDDVILLEYTHLPVVMNGWIFAWWGLYDYVKLTADTRYRDVMERSCQSLERHLPLFSTGYWSKYDLDYRIASPFYHRLHIAQMTAMHQLTGRETFAEYAAKWTHNQESLWCRWKAFIIKAYQKIKEKE